MVESVAAIEEILTKKVENRPVTPEEYTMLGQFVDRVERRTIQIKEDAVRAEEEKVSGARAEVPTAAFAMPLDQAGLKEHVLNILVEAGIDNVGALMMTLKMDPNKVLGLPGVGPKAMQNIEEVIAALIFPEPTPPAEPEVAPVAEAVSKPEIAVSPIAGETAPVIEVPLGEKEISAKKEKRIAESEDNEHAKDGVSLDDLFSMKPEIFQTAPAADDADDKKKGKKGKKKSSVALEFDEERGEVVARKVHKRDGGTWTEE